MTKQGGWPETGFGRRLKKLREAKGLTGEQLANASGCHPMTISKLERGVQEPAWPLVLALCTALGVGVTAFVEDAEEVPAGEKPKQARGRPAKPKPEASASEQAKKKSGRPRKDESR